MGWITIFEFDSFIYSLNPVLDSCLSLSPANTAAVSFSKLTSRIIAFFSANAKGILLTIE